jgi:hypothetical protein
MGEHSELPDGLAERNPEWHIQKFMQFTERKQSVNEPSPHLAMVGYMSSGLKVIEKVWRIGCYAIPYSLPVGMMMWEAFDSDQAMANPAKVAEWVEHNWKGILAGTRRERRCVRTFKKYNECTLGYIQFMKEGLPKVLALDKTLPLAEYYDKVWEEVGKVKYFGRYIGIRVVEGLRRFCNIPAELPDIRSMGAWSPRKCLVYIYPDKADILLNESASNNKATEDLAWQLSKLIKVKVPTATHYVVAAMLCEYRDAFEDRRQYVGWTIDQEPLLFKKSAEYFGHSLDADLFWKTRTALFPIQALGEWNKWEGTRWDITNVLRDYGYVWSDLVYDYGRTTDFSNPVRRN